MKKMVAGFVVSVLLVGCSTTSNVMVGNPDQIKPIHTVAFVPQGGNSSDMDGYIQRDLRSRGIDVRATAAPGTRKMADVDAVVGYSDTWRWDLVMYLKSLDLDIFDADSGSLLVSGHWENSALHGFQDPAGVVKQVMDEMFRKMGGSKPESVGDTAH
jgi:hypothetical protein